MAGACLEGGERLAVARGGAVLGARRGAKWATSATVPGRPLSAAALGATLAGGCPQTSGAFLYESLSEPLSPRIVFFRLFFMMRLVRQESSPLGALLKCRSASRRPASYAAWRLARRPVCSSAAAATAHSRRPARPEFPCLDNEARPAVTHCCKLAHVKSDRPLSPASCFFPGLCFV